MPTAPYTPISDCHPVIQMYAGRLENGTDDHDEDARSTRSLTRYEQDLKWLNDWLNEEDLGRPQDMTETDADNLGMHLGQEFNGRTGLGRWNLIKRFYKWMEASNRVENNPLMRWDDVKKSQYGLTRTTEQERQLGEDEAYAPTPEEIRLFEEHAGRQHRTRNQLIIRCLFQTMMRPGELARLRLDDVNSGAREIDIRDAIAKNENGRVVAYQPSLDGLMKKYVDVIRPDRMAGKDHDRLFVGERGGKMSRVAISDVVRKAAERADEAHPDRNLQRDLFDTQDGQSRAKVTGHSPRHAGATYCANETDMDIYDLSRALGHSSVEITERKYVEDDRDAATDAMHRYGPE